MQLFAVAGHAVELTLALGVASAPGQGRGLEPDRAGVGGGDGATLGAVALAAELDDGAETAVSS